MNSQDLESTLHVLFLDERALKALDPLGAGQKWFTTHFPTTENYEQPSPLFKGAPAEILAKYCESFLSPENLQSKHRPIVEYELEMLSKCGRQGGAIPWKLARPIFAAYYCPKTKVDLGEVTRVGMETLIGMIDAAVAEYGYPQPVYGYQYASTAAGSPFGMHKNIPHHHAQASLNGWQHAQPLWPNVRRMRSKDRGIFCASQWDCDYVQPILTAVRLWVKQYFPHMFGAWLEPSLYTYPDISKGVLRRKWFLETDFKAMDQHVSWDLIRQVILPIYQHLLPPADYLHLAQFVEESFTAPLQCGSELWTGLHTLFSGLPYTNDFETWLDIVAYLGAHCLSGQTPLTFQERIKALGDDVVYWTDSEELARAVYDLVASEFDAWGVTLSKEKTRLQQAECRFCRQVYYPACKREFNELGQEFLVPAYPMVLTVNNCLQPERTQPSRSEELLVLFNRCDNAYGHPYFSNVVNFLFNNMKKEAIWPISPETTVKFEEIQRKDWWFKVYGSTYTLGESLTYNEFCKRLKH